MKGMKLDESKFKRVSVSLLSTQSAVEDSMRFLLILALMDGVLDGGLNSWENLMRLRPPPTGTLLRIKPSMAELSVFRKVGADNTLSDLPELQGRVQSEIRRLRFACGFQQRLTGYAWRRGAAYILDKNASEESRRFLMGHKSDSKVFSSYMSKVTDVDLQALFRGKEQHDLRRMMSISLNRKVDAPTRISDAGYTDVLADLALTALEREFSTIQAAICSEHSSVIAASRAYDPRFEEYRSLFDRRRNLKTSLIQKKFREEYTAFFAQVGCTMEPAPAASGSGGQNFFSTMTYSRRSSSSASNLTNDILHEPLLFTSESVPMISGDSLCLSELDYFESAADTVEDSDEIALPAESNTQTLLEGEGDDGENNSDLADQTAATLQLTVPTSRLHRLPNKSLTRHYQRGSSRYYIGSNHCVDLYEALTGCGNESRLMQKAIECFSITYRIDTFYPGQEPLPGTYSCPVCYAKLQQEHGKYDPKLGNSPWVHIFNCTKNVLLETAKDEIRTRCPFNQPCQFQKLVAAGSVTALQTCGHIADSWTGLHNHLTNHLKIAGHSHVTDGTSQRVWYCLFKGCARDLSPRRTARIADATPPRNDPRFSSPEELHSHLAARHNIIYKQNEIPNIMFCQYCETWLGPFDDPVAHIISHEIDAARLVEESGYEAPTAKRLLRPDLCIFCYHDHDIPLHKRIAPNAFGARVDHFRVHLSKISDKSSTKCPAYPEMCNCDTLFSKAHLVTHLNKTHGITIPGKIGKRKRADSGVQVLKEKSINTTIEACTGNVMKLGKI